jgi:hypothetical protein
MAIRSGCVTHRSYFVLMARDVATAEEDPGREPAGRILVSLCAVRRAVDRERHEAGADRRRGRERPAQAWTHAIRPCLWLSRITSAVAVTFEPRARQSGSKKTSQKPRLASSPPALVGRATYLERLRQPMIPKETTVSRSSGFVRPNVREVAVSINGTRHVAGLGAGFYLFQLASADNRVDDLKAVTFSLVDGREVTRVVRD